MVPSFMKDAPSSNPTVRPTSLSDGWTSHRLPKTGVKQISTYVEAVNFLLKFYATDSNISKAAPEKVCLKIASMKNLIVFADVLPSKIVRWGNAYPEDRTKPVFISGLPSNKQSAVRMFWGSEKDTHLLEIAQYADILLVQTRLVPILVVAPVQRSCFQRGRQTASIVAAAAVKTSRSPINVHHVTQKSRERFFVNNEVMVTITGSSNWRVIVCFWRKNTK